MHDMVHDIFYTHRAEGADTDVQGEEVVRDFFEELGGEMKPSGRRGDGPFLTGEDCLIAVAIGDFILAAHVVRQCEVAVLVEIHRRVPTDKAVTIFKNFGHDAANAAADVDAAPEFHAFTRPHEAAPFEGREPVEAEQFRLSIVGKNPSGDDLGIVQDQ